MPHPQRIGLMAAMPEELQAVLDAMPDESPRQLSSRSFWCGHLDGVEVVAVLSGIGKVAAAITTTLLIHEFKVDALLFTGVAGGLAPVARVGDIVVADTLVQHDLDASPIFPRYEIPGRGRSHLPASADWSARVRDAATRALRPEHLHAGPGAVAAHLQALGVVEPQVHTGLILSGDRFVSSRAESRALRQAFPQALAVEMEGAAVAQVCTDSDLPFAVVRTLSDRADDDAHPDFMRFVDQVARHYSLAVVRATLASLKP